MTTRKLLAAAAMTMTAACSTARPVRAVAQKPPQVQAVATVEAPPPVLRAILAISAPAAATPEAAAPRCDEHGRPLAGNVRTKGPMQECVGQ